MGRRVRSSLCLFDTPDGRDLAEEGIIRAFLWVLDGIANHLLRSLHQDAVSDANISGKGSCRSPRQSCLYQQFLFKSDLRVIAALRLSSILRHSFK